MRPVTGRYARGGGQILHRIDTCDYVSRATRWLRWTVTAAGLQTSQKDGLILRNRMQGDAMKQEQLFSL